MPPSPVPPPPDARPGAWRELGGAVVGAFSSMPRGVAWGAVVLAACAVPTRTPWPVAWLVVAFAAGASLGPRPFTSLVLVLLGLEATLLAVLAGAPELAAAAVFVVGFAAALGSNLRARLGPSPEPLVPVAVAAQRHPWTATTALLLFVGIDAVLSVSYRRAGLVQIVAPAVALAVAVPLCVRSADLLGRLAPLGAGLPLATAITAAVFAVGFGAPDPFLPAALCAPLAAWCAGFAYLAARRREPTVTRRALTVVWIVLAATLPAVDRSRHAAGAIEAFLGWVAAPFVVAACADLRGSASRILLCAAVLGAASALAAAVVPPWEPTFSRIQPVSGDLLWEFADDAPGETTRLLRHVELAVLLAACGRLIAVARSLTAVPRDHPVFTEGPALRLDAPPAAAA